MHWSVEEIVASDPVIELIKRRAGGGKRGSEKLGLVIEGGAMRGVVAAGAVLALERLGLRDSFDAVYGMSAGAITGSYFVAGQASVGASIFYDDLATSDFLDFKKILSKDSILNLDYLEEVVRDIKPLDTEEVLRHDISIFALNTKTALVEKLPQASDRGDLLRQLRAACTMPFLVRETTKYRGESYIDAGLNVSVPWRQALDDGCSHILVLLTRVEKSPRQGLRFLEKKLVANRLARENPDLIPLFLRRAEDYNSDLEDLYAASGDQISIIVPPSGSTPVRGFELGRNALVRGAILGSQATYKKLFQTYPKFREIITPVSDFDRLEREEKGKSLRQRLGF